MTDRELLQQALEALLNYPLTEGKAIQAIRTRLAQPEPEPVADKYLMEVECTKCGAKQDGILTVNAPQKKEWVGLTGREIVDLFSDSETELEFARAIEAKLKEKNNDR